MAVFGDNIPFWKKLANVLYREARCGLFHDGLTRSRIFVARGGLAPLIVQVPADGRLKIERVMIDPEKWLAEIEKRHADYVAQLRDPGNVEVRANFVKAWTLLHAPQR